MDTDWCCDQTDQLLDLAVELRGVDEEYTHLCPSRPSFPPQYERPIAGMLALDVVLPMPQANRALKTRAIAGAVACTSYAYALGSMRFVATLYNSARLEDIVDFIRTVRLVRELDTLRDSPGRARLGPLNRWHLPRLQLDLLELKQDARHHVPQARPRRDLGDRGCAMSP